MEEGHYYICHCVSDLAPDIEDGFPGFDHQRGGAEADVEAHGDDIVLIIGFGFVHRYILHVSHRRYEYI